jgi:hypothetical protein
LQGEKTTQTQSCNTPNLTFSQQRIQEKKHFFSVYGTLSLSFPSPPVFSIFSTYLTLLTLHFYLLVVHKHKGIIPLYRKTIVCLEGFGMFHQYQEDSLFLVGSRMFHTHQEDSLLKDSGMFHQHQEDFFFLENSRMFHQHQEDSFFLEKETIVDICKTREKVLEDSAY